MSLQLMATLAKEFALYELHVRVHREAGCCCLDRNLRSPCCPQHTISLIASEALAQLDYQP